MRLVLVIGSCIGAFLFPWWIFVGLLFVGFLFYPRYLEGCVLALLYDVTYAGTPLFGVHGALTLAAVIVFSIRELLVSRLRNNVFIS